MPDVSTLSDEQLRKLKSENYHKIAALRAESLQAEERLQELRAAQYAAESTPEYVAQKNAEYAEAEGNAAVAEAANIVSPGASAAGEAPPPR